MSEKSFFRKAINTVAALGTAGAVSAEAIPPAEAAQLTKEPTPVTAEAQQNIAEERAEFLAGWEKLSAAAKETLGKGGEGIVAGVQNGMDASNARALLASGVEAILPYFTNPAGEQQGLSAKGLVQELASAELLDSVAVETLYVKFPSAFSDGK